MTDLSSLYLKTFGGLLLTLADGVLPSCRHPGGSGGLDGTVPANEGRLYLKRLYYVLQECLDVENMLLQNT